MPGCGCNQPSRLPSNLTPAQNSFREFYLQNVSSAGAVLSPVPAGVILSPGFMVMLKGPSAGTLAENTRVVSQGPGNFTISPPPLVPLVNDLVYVAGVVNPHVFPRLDLCPGPYYQQQENYRIKPRVWDRNTSGLP
jgi:hypothetical protein